MPGSNSNSNSNTGSTTNSNSNANSNASDSIYALYSARDDSHISAFLRLAQFEGWYWPQVYYFIVDSLQHNIPEIGDSDVRSIVYQIFRNDYNGRGNYDDYFNYMDDWESGLYRQYMNVPPQQMNPNARNRVVENVLNRIQRMGIIQPGQTNNNYGSALQGLYMNPLPRNAKNAITMDPIEEGQTMVNFHGEFDQGRYYTKNTYNSINPKRNPYTRQNILPKNVIHYRAHLQGGKHRKRTYRKASKKTTRKAQKFQ